MPGFVVPQLVGQKVFTVFLLHINNVFAKKRGIAKKIIQTIRALMISQDIDSVAGDFNGTAWRCRSWDNISTDKEVFSDCALPTPPLWGPGSIPNNWADVCGFLKPPGSQRFWKVSKHGAFSIPRQALGLRSSDQSCHHETWIHLHFVDWNNKWSQQTHYNGPQKRNISEILSDHSQSSRTRNHLRIPGSCEFNGSSSRSDLMSFDDLAGLP